MRFVSVVSLPICCQCGGVTMKTGEWRFVIPSSLTLENAYFFKILWYIIAWFQNQKEHRQHLEVVECCVLIVQTSKNVPLPASFMQCCLRRQTYRDCTARLSKTLRRCSSVMQKGPARYYGEFTALPITVCNAILPRIGNVPALSAVKLKHCSPDLFPNDPTPHLNCKITGWWLRSLAQVHRS